MSLETLLEAAEFLEWNKAGKKTASRATRTSKKAEKFKPYVIPDKKKRCQSQKASGRSSGSTNQLTIRAHKNGSSKVIPFVGVSASDGDLAAETELERAKADEEQQITLREIRKSIGNRETHNKLEKNRRAHLKECFEELRNELPVGDERRTSNLGTLRSALRLIEQLVSQQKELESEKRRMQRVKNSRQAHINSLRKELQDKGIEYKIEDWIEQHETSTNSTSTAPECGEVMMDTSNQESKEDITSANVMETVPINIQPTSEVSNGQGVQFTQQAACQVSQQTVVKVQAHSLSTISGVGKATQVPKIQQQQATQAVTVAKITQGGIGPPAKIVLTPKILPAAPDTQQQTIQVGQNQMYIASPANPSVMAATTNANFFISPPAQQAQAVPVAASAPLTLNLQTGKVISPQQTTQVLYNKPVSEQGNLNIAPKQLVLITTPNQQKVRAFAAPSGGAQLNPIAPAVTPGATVTLTPAPSSQTTVSPQSQANIIPISSFASVPAVQQTTAIKPTIITGMLPSTANDGTISYVPIQLTPRPAVTVATRSLPQTSDATVTSSSLPTAFLSGSAGGSLALVIPTAAANSAQAVQLVTGADSQTATIQITPTAAVNHSQKSASSSATSAT